jgi:hypothetical protein
MKSQRRLRLRQTGRHHLVTREQALNDWARRLAPDKLAHAFQMNCAPKHSTESLDSDHYTMDYVTGSVTWHTRIMLHDNPVPAWANINRRY